jgi:hypothetical protein
MAAQGNQPPEGMLGKLFTILWLDYSITPTQVLGNHADNCLSHSGSEQNNPTVPPSAQDTNSPAVRFASTNQEIEPAHIVDSVEATPPSHDLLPEDEAKLKELATALNTPRLQERRMSAFAFEPVSLPASRVCLPSVLYPPMMGLMAMGKNVAG